MTDHELDAILRDVENRWRAEPIVALVQAYRELRAEHDRAVRGCKAALADREEAMREVERLRAFSVDTLHGDSTTDNT